MPGSIFLGRNGGVNGVGQEVLHGLSSSGYSQVAAFSLGQCVICTNFFCKNEARWGGGRALRPSVPNRGKRLCCTGFQRLFNPLRPGGPAGRQRAVGDTESKAGEAFPNPGRARCSRATGIAHGAPRR
jgi:hypothetical protein